VTVPIKLRAVVLGFLSGWRDCWHYHDNSFWVSFGQAEAVIWVQVPSDGLTPSGLARHGPAWPGLTRPCLAWPDVT